MKQLPPGSWQPGLQGAGGTFSGAWIRAPALTDRPELSCLDVVAATEDTRDATPPAAEDVSTSFAKDDGDYRERMWRARFCFVLRGLGGDHGGEGFGSEAKWAVDCCSVALLCGKDPRTRTTFAFTTLCGNVDSRVIWRCWLFS